MTGQVDGEGSDERYRNRIARILESKKKEKEETPSQRRERLLKNFHNDKVIMVSLPVLLKFYHLSKKPRDGTVMLQYIVMNSSVHEA